MEDKLLYFPKTQNDVLWKDVKNSFQNETSEWVIKQDSSGSRIGTLSLNNIHKLYVTLIGGGGSGSIGEKRPKNNSKDYAIEYNSYTAYTNMVPLPGCGGGGGATLFRIPIILIQTHSTTIDYDVGRGGKGMTDTSDSHIKTAQERLGKNGENTSIVIKQLSSSGEEKIFKIKAVGGGGGGVVGYTRSREYLWNNMSSNDVQYIWDWSFGAEHNIDDTEKTLVDKASYDSNLYQWWNIRHGDDKTEIDYDKFTHFNYLAEHWTAIFKRPSYAHVAFHRELEFPIGSDLESETAYNRNEYIPYNLLTHGEDGISKLEYFKPYDKIKLSNFATEKYFGGPYDGYQPSEYGEYRTIMDPEGVNGRRLFNFGLPTETYYNFLWQYAPEQHYIDNRSWVQIWGYNIDRLRDHPRYYLRTGDIYFYKDRSIHYPTGSYLPTMSPMREKITIFAESKEDIVLNKWSAEFTGLMNDYGGPVKKIPQIKGTTGAFGGGGGGFLHYDDPTPQTLHGLYGGKEMFNVWKIPESGGGGNPYPKQIWNTIDVKILDASGLDGAYYYWGGEGYEDADSRGKSCYMTTYFIPGSGGGALDYHHQNNRISRRKYTEQQEIDFADILPAMSESPYTDIDDRVYKWYAQHHDELATGGKIMYRNRDISNNAIISRLYMNDLYGTHKINFTNKGETGPRSAEDLLMIFGAGGGGLFGGIDGRG